jgi:hypothetical protein
MGLVLQRALAREPHDRYPTVSAFAADLRKAAQDETQQVAVPSLLTSPARPHAQGVPSPTPGLSVPSAPAQRQRAQPAAPPIAAGGSTSSIPSFSEGFHQNGKDPLNLKINISGPIVEEISQKLQQSQWTLRAFILNLVICAVLIVGAAWISSLQISVALSLALSLWPALLVGPLVGRLFRNVPVSSYAWGVLWGMIFGIVNAFLSTLVCCAWTILFKAIYLRQFDPSQWLSLLGNIGLSQPVLLLIIGLWISVSGGALIGLLAARAQR